MTIGLDRLGIRHAFRFPVAGVAAGFGKAYRRHFGLVHFDRIQGRNLEIYAAQRHNHRGVLPDAVDIFRGRHLTVFAVAGHGNGHFRVGVGTAIRLHIKTKLFQRLVT